MWKSDILRLGQPPFLSTCHQVDILKPEAQCKHINNTDADSLYFSSADSSLNATIVLATMVQEIFKTYWLAKVSPVSISQSALQLTSRRIHP